MVSVTSESSLNRVRRLCLSWPEVEERLSHGEPTWFHRGKRSLATYADHHHDDRLAFWCASPPGACDLLVEADPGRYFVPPYVGHRGWLGVYLDVEVDWVAVEQLVGTAYLTIAARDR